MNNRNEYQLGDILTLYYGKALPAHKRNKGNVPVYSSAGLTGYHDEALVQSEGLILGRKGTIGKIYKSKKPFFVIDTAYYITPNEKYDLDFIYYLLQTIGLEELNEDSAVPGLNRETAYSQTILFPDVETQKSIASILSSLDDKIDLLHRQNKTLEALAETLFRHWFSEQTNEGSEFVELGDYVDCYNGVSYKSIELNPSNIAMVTLKSFDRSGVFRMDGFKEFTGKFKEQQIICQGDLVVAHTDITQDAAIIGNPALVVGVPSYKTMLISMDVVKVKAKESWLSNQFLYLLMKTERFKNHCVSHSNGSTVLHLSKKAIPSYKFMLPKINKLVSFNQITHELFLKYFQNIEKTRNLKTLRDMLLPKLMSGEILIK